MPKRVNTTKQQQEEIVNLYTQEEMSIPSVAAQTHVSPSVVRRILLKAGASMRLRGAGGHKRGYGKSFVATLVAEYASGTPSEDLAIKYRVSVPQLMRWVRDAGQTIRPKGFQKGADHHQWKGGIIQTPQGYIQELVRPEDPYRKPTTQAGQARQGCRPLVRRLRFAQHSAHATKLGIQHVLQDHQFQRHARNGPVPQWRPSGRCLGDQGRCSF